MKKLYEVYYYWGIQKIKQRYFPYPFEIDIRVVFLANILFNAKMRKVENFHNPIYDENLIKVYYDEF